MRNHLFLTRVSPLSVAALACAWNLTPAHAQASLGEVGAASSASSGMSSSSGSGTMAVGARAAQDARRLGGSSNSYEAYGSGSSSSSPGGSGSGSSSSGSPNYPNPSGSGSSSSGGESGAGGAATAPPPPEAFHWGNERGEDYLRELLKKATGAPGTGRSVGLGRKYTNKELARMPDKKRSKVIAQRYKKPPIGYLSYYLPQDRYKMTSGVWKYVSIEDDRARYPVKFYFRPDSPSFLRILAQRPINSQPRYNRVIGFHTWQDAMVAGYRPDPISKPSPGIELAYLATISPRDALAHYTEFVYAGQVNPQIFARNYAYIRRVQNVVNARPDTRKYLKPTVGQILFAATGIGRVPTQVGEVQRPTFAAQGEGAPPNYGGAGFGGGSGSSSGSGSSGYGSSGSGSSGYGSSGSGSSGYGSSGYGSSGSGSYGSSSDAGSSLPNR